METPVYRGLYSIAGPGIVVLFTDAPAVLGTRPDTEGVAHFPEQTESQDGNGHPQYRETGPQPMAQGVAQDQLEELHVAS